MFKSINLGALRIWIQHNCIRGDEIIFGSDTEVHFRGQFTYKKFEKLVSKVVKNNQTELIKDFLRIIEMQKNLDNQDFENRYWNELRIESSIKEMKEYIKLNKS